MYRSHQLGLSTRVVLVFGDARRPQTGVRHEQVRADIVRRVTPNIRSHVQVGEKGVAVDGTKWNNKHNVEHLCWEKMRL